MDDIDNRFARHSLDGEQEERREEIRAKAREMARLICDACPTSRERALALTKLQECAMWANASVACN